MADDLGKLLIRAEHLRDGILTPQDARALSHERIERFEALGVIESDGHAQEIVYDGCDHDCTVVNSGFQKHPDDATRSICVHRCLNGCGRVVLEAHDFEQWRFSLLGFAEAVRSAIGASGEVIEDVPGRVVLVGTVSVAGRVGEVFLGYGLARSDAAGVVASAPRLAAAEHPAVLSVGVKPGNIWSVGKRPLTAVLAEHVSLGSEGLVLDLAAVFPASGMIEVKPDEWLTVTDAAKLLMKDLPWLTLEKAKSRVSRASGEVSKFTTNGIKGGKRRIEPKSFDSWRLKQRDLDLAKDDSNL
ncbi:MAG: hypothetical protein KDA29_15030 [Phycisphaerales bacterium]|nr:hypothetical protein [Phycisphaerales bacterium]